MDEKMLSKIGSREFMRELKKIVCFMFSRTLQAPSDIFQNFLINFLPFLRRCRANLCQIHKKLFNGSALHSSSSLHLKFPLTYSTRTRLVKLLAPNCKTCVRLMIPQKSHSTTCFARRSVQLIIKLIRARFDCRSLFGSHLIAKK